MAVSVPVAIDFLKWDWNCDSLVRRLVQSDKRMGHDATPSPVAKVLLVDRFVTIGKLECVQKTACAKAPGTVVAIEENSWRVATADGVVKISDFLDEFGQSVSAQTIANQCHVTEGDQLPIITPEQSELIANQYVQAMSAESYWAHKLENFERAQIFFMRKGGTQSTTWATTSQQSSKDATAIDVLTAWLIYIARDAQISKIQVGCDATENWHEYNGLSTRFMFAKTVPFGTTIDLNETFLGVVGSVRKDYKELVKHLPCLSGILNSHAVSSTLRSKEQWALAVSLIDTLNDDKHFTTEAKLAPHAHGSLMTLQISKKSGAFRWIYDQNQISKEEINRISSRLLALLTCAYTENEAEKAVAKLNLLPKAERDLLLYTWNQTTVIIPLNRCLHQLFEEQVELDGQAIAVEFDGQTLSYAQLNIQSNRLAHYLIAKGVKLDDPVALCVERSITMVVAMLAILKSGGAYVPIDPAYPSQRLTQILQDADPKLLLADSVSRKVLGDHQIPVIELEEPLPADLSCENPDATNLGLTPRHLAYIIYTSGSTGKPKGVMVEHHAVAQLFKSVHGKFDIDKADKLCLFHSISYDISVWEMWAALMNGSQLSIVPQNIVLSPEDFYEWICSKGITVLRQTPSVFKMVLRSNKFSSRRDRLRFVIFGGETLDPVILREWYAKYDENQTMLASLYGSTEAANNATCWIVDNKMFENGIIAIGRPLPTKRIYLLDAHGEPVPIGMEGEIYIGGDALARGYLNRPELTAERFISDPFSDDPAARMYRTGDRARYLPDGNLICMGRTDQQVKIRGFRIELGEIEARLVEHPQVREAVVQPFVYDNGSDVRLVAYVVGDSHTTLAQDLRTYLSNLLPEYMVPSAYVSLPSLPLTPNGKLDRRALPAPDDNAFARQQYEAPQTEMEEILADIWRDLLNIERISRHDNFFALGGHSLLVIRLLSQLRQIGLNTTVREVFNALSLAKLAATLNRYKAVDIPPNLITTDSTEITAEMLPLITLTQADIAAIIAQIPGGISNIQDIYGLAPLQSGMLFHHIKSGRGDPYLQRTSVCFVDRAALQRYADALQQVISRHDILRTVFIWQGLNEPAQVVLRRVPSLLTEIVMDDNTDESIFDQLNHRFNPQHYRFDLTQAPLLRLMAAQTSEGSWVALQLMHHIISDHSTMEKLMAEVHAIIDDKTEDLTTPTPFRHLVAHARLGTSPDEHKRFFTEMLSDIDEPTLPFGLNDVSLDGTEINEANLKLPQTLGDQLREHARKLQVSLASICHLAWAQVIARASGREAVVFGTVLLGGLQAGEENDNMMGPMINTLPIRIDVDEKSVEIAVRHTHARLSALLAHEHAPLVLAQRCSGVPNGSPLFSAILNYRHDQTQKQITTSLLGITFSDDEGKTNYPLTMSLDDNDDTLCMSAQMKSPLSAARICGNMQQSLESIVDALIYTPQREARTLAVVPPEERTLLLNTWNQTTISPSIARCLHQLFEEQVECDGWATAVECDGKTLSYSELNAQANRLAHYLIARGVNPDDCIALCVERNMTMIIAMLGILKAGGAYVPLDPIYSNQRLTHILNDAGPAFLLVDTIGRKALGDHQLPIVDLDKPLHEDLPIHNSNATEIRVSPANLAYVIYTSGSTGTPKGVMIEHQHIVRLFEATQDKFEFNEQDKWSLFHSISFDFSVWEIWGALSAGSQLSIVPHNVTQSPHEFYDWICSNRITVLNQTPSAFRMLMGPENISLRPSQLRYIIFGGDTLDPQIVKEWHEKDIDGQTILANMYGPTETAIIATIWIDDSTVTENSVIPIGRSLLNKPLYLLDAHGELVPLGAEGELYIGGAGVARGYLNRPELTTQRFLPDPFSEDPTARIYRTGDRARYLPDGNLVYLGRTDQQVKIRGFRIELGEMEAHLVAHPQVREAVVQPHESGSDARLVAYIVTDTDTLVAQDLRSYLSSLLPDYMVPAAYVYLPFLPLTPNGKLDRRALPAPDDDAFVRQQYEAPQGEMEEKLADIWLELLGIERISRYDNFFALGGHSLLVVRLMSRLRQIRLDTTVREVFDASSLATLASTLTRYKAVAIPPNLITADSTNITPEMLPLISLSQTEIDTIIKQIPGGVTNIQDIYGLAPLQSGMLFHHIKTERGDPFLLTKRMQFSNRSVLKRYANALQQVTERHDILRSIFIWEGLNEPAQVVLRQVPQLLTEITLENTDDSALEQLYNKFNSYNYCLTLSQAPLLRLMASSTSEGNWVAVQLMHHIIADHLTLEKLVAEAHAIINGKVEELPTPTSFRHFVAQARRGTTPDEHKRFFTKMLGDVDVPTFPFGLGDVDLDNNEINEANLKLPQTLNDQLREHARNLQVSLASICHLAWAQVLARASGREAVVFGTVLLGRLQTGERNNEIMGPMINTLPIRIDVDERSVEAAVRDTHMKLSALLDHEYAPLVLAQRCSGVSTGLPLFSAILNYRHNQKKEQVIGLLPGVTVFDCKERTNYPIALSVEDDGDSLELTPQIVSTIPATRVGALMQQALESLANALVQMPQQQVRALEVIPPEERTLLLDTWNQTTFAFSSPARYLHQLFEDRVECDGQATAVECSCEVLTYKELNAQANRLAHYLIVRGVKPDDRIAICVDRNMKLLVAMLGILKAGGAYVPLDPVYSSQRLTDILNDSDPIFLLADATGRRVLGDHQIRVVDLDEPLSEDLPIKNPDATKLGLTPANLAYVIYTSGSTGTPKGVMVEHQQVVRLFDVTKSKFDFNKQDKWCLFHSFSFDVSVWEIWGAFLAGSQLSIAPSSIIRSPNEFYNWICRNEITVLNQTPSAFKTLIRTEHINLRSDKLRYVIFAGEELDPQIVKDWNGKYGDSQTVLVNMYGPTETAIYATYQRLETLENAYSIGRPLPDLCSYLLDSYGEPVPLGAEGELYIGGAGVARGYLNRPELTAERFLSNPFIEDPAARMYRTGDRARYLPDGNLIYLGRNDQQVKIRGFRIELGEIETQLVTYPQVREATIQPLCYGSDTRLVAYVVADESTLLPQALRTYLSNLLPDYMVPAAYVSLPFFPLTPNGKLDRRALPIPSNEAFARQQYETPQNDTEEKLAEIWSELLSIDRISRHDNFFELGGHSLLVMQVINKAKLCNLSIDARGVFSFPILKDLAEQITKHANRMYCDDPIPIRQYGNENPLFLLPEGLGGISYAFEFANDIDKSIPVYMLPWPSPEEKQPSSIEEMAHAIISVMRRTQACGPYSIVGYSAGGILAYEMAKQLISTGHSVSFLGLIDTYLSLENRNSQIETATEAKTESESESNVLLLYLLRTFPVLKTIDDPEWWSNIIKLPHDEAIEEIKKKDIELKNIDFEWEKLLSKQRHNFINICEYFNADPLPIKVHFFKATEALQNSIFVPHMDHIFTELANSKKFSTFSEKTWENCNISANFDVIEVDGDHLTMMTDPKNRSLLGKKLSKSLLSSMKMFTDNSI